MNGRRVVWPALLAVAGGAICVFFTMVILNAPADDKHVTYGEFAAILGATTSWLCLIGAITLVVGAWFAIANWRDEKWNDRVICGLCGKCGYDLRSSAEFCPECGFPILDKR